MYAQARRFNVPRCKVIAMKKFFSLTILILVLFVANVEAAKTSPADDVYTFCDAIFHGNEVSLQKFGLTNADYENLFISELTKLFTTYEGITFSENQVAKVRESIKSLFKRSEFSTETVSQKKDKATVKVTVGSFEKITEELFSKNLPANIDQMSQDEQVDAFANMIALTLTNLQIVGTADFTIECTYEKEINMWLATDNEKFGEVLMNKMFNLE